MNQVATWCTLCRAFGNNTNKIALNLCIVYQINTLLNEYGGFSTSCAVAIFLQDYFGNASSRFINLFAIFS